MRIKKVCGTCKSENVFVDASAEWDVTAQAWILQNEFVDNAYCEDCAYETTIEDQPTE